MLPTPIADRAPYHYSHGKKVYSLRGMAEKGQLPTPTASAARQSGSYPRGNPTLRGAIGGPLAPRFVEWMMGLPIGHTALKRLETPSFRSWSRCFSAWCMTLWADLTKRTPPCK